MCQLITSHSVASALTSLTQSAATTTLGRIFQKLVILTAEKYVNRSYLLQQAQGLSKLPQVMLLQLYYRGPIFETSYDNPKICLSFS